MSMLPNRRVRVYEFLAIYEGQTYDVKSINKQKKTAILMMESGDMTVKLEDVDEIIKYNDYLSN